MKYLKLSFNSICLSLLFLLILASCHSHKHGTSGNDTALGYFASYTLSDAKYGTETIVSLEDGFRIIKTNALPNHETGKFPNPGNPNVIAAQNRTYKLPLNPVYTGKPKRVRETGVALNGIKFEPGTGEVVYCESGENFRIEAIQDLFDLGLDHNHAHVQPTGAYHYHGSPTELINDNDHGNDMIHIGFALDGFPIYYSKSEKYKPSYRIIDETREGADCTYQNPKVGKSLTIQDSKADGSFVNDWEYIPGLGSLDECNGIKINGEYRYFVTDSYPYVGRCLMGEFTELRGGPPPGRRGRTPGQRGERPDRNGERPPREKHG